MSEPSQTSENPASPKPGDLVGNLGKPIRLTNVELAGYSTQDTKAGENAEVRVKGELTTLDPIFHRVVGRFQGYLQAKAHEAGRAIRLARHNITLLVIRPDKTAELWLDTAAIALQMMVKRDVEAGQAVFQKDIVDIRAMCFPAVQRGAEDRVLCLFREGWHFGLVYNLSPDEPLDVEAFQITLGSVLRRLRYWELYDTVANIERFNGLVAAGWFPFIEIIGDEFYELSDTIRAGFDLEQAEAKLVSKFDEARLKHILERWLVRPHLAPRKQILEPAITSFLAKKPVATIKIVLTEIEGVLADAYQAKNGKRVKLKELLEFAAQEATAKSGASDTLFLPEAFGQYLNGYTFANFDPAGPPGNAGSRHAVGHGAAAAESYTMSRALQAILTLDQLGFYTA